MLQRHLSYTYAFIFIVLQMYDLTRATSKPLPISNGRIHVCEKMSEDILPSIGTTDPR